MVLDYSKLTAKQKREIIELFVKYTIGEKVAVSKEYRPFINDLTKKMGVSGRLNESEIKNVKNLVKDLIENLVSEPKKSKAKKKTVEKTGRKVKVQLYTTKDVKKLKEKGKIPKTAPSKTIPLSAKEIERREQVMNQLVAAKKLILIKALDNVSKRKKLTPLQLDALRIALPEKQRESIMKEYRTDMQKKAMKPTDSFVQKNTKRLNDTLKQMYSDKPILETQKTLVRRMLNPEIYKLVEESIAEAKEAKKVKTRSVKRPPRKGNRHNKRGGAAKR